MKREICVENLMTVEIVAAAGVDYLTDERRTVINGVQCGVVIWQILRKFTAAVTALGRYLSSAALNGNWYRKSPLPPALIGTDSCQSKPDTL